MKSQLLPFVYVLFALFTPPRIILASEYLPNLPNPENLRDVVWRPSYLKEEILKTEDLWDLDYLANHHHHPFKVEHIAWFIGKQPGSLPDKKNLEGKAPEQEIINRVQEELKNPNISHDFQSDLLMVILRLAKGRDHEEALEKLTLLAKEGNASAQCNLGEVLNKGINVQKNNEEGLQWIKKSADQNYAPALMKMAFFMDDTNKHNHKTIIELHSKAAQQGYAPSLCFLGSFFLTGCYGLEKNYHTSVCYLTGGKKQGHQASAFSFTEAWNLLMTKRL